MAEFTAQYDRKFSDGEYGSVGLSLSWTWESDDDDGEASSESIEAAIAFLRNTVLNELSKSPAQRVAWAARRELKPPDAVPVTNHDGVPVDGEPVSLEDIPF